MEFLNKVTLKGIVHSVYATKVADKYNIRFSLLTENCFTSGGNSCIESTWHHCSIFSDKEDAIKKGDVIKIDGRLKQVSYVSNDGTNRYSTEIVVNSYSKEPEKELPRFYGD